MNFLNFFRLIFLSVFAFSFGIPSIAQNKSNEPIPSMPKLLSQREQMDVREAWLKERLGSLLLPMMKRHGVEMWIVVNEEFHSDPVTDHIVDFRRGIGGDEEELRLGSYTSIELNSSTNVAEWAGQKVTIMAEDDAVMTPTGFRFIRPRQTEFYLIK